MLLNYVIPADWQEWVADCLMNQVAVDLIVKELHERGHFPEKMARKYVTETAAHPFIIAGTKMTRQLKRRDWLLDLFRRLETQSGLFEHIEERTEMNRDEFYKHYHPMNRPFIWRGGAQNWDIMSRWTPEYFKAQYGDREVQVTHLDQTTLRKSFPKMPFSEYIDTITTCGESNAWYMTNATTEFNKSTVGDLFAEVDRFPELLDPEGFEPNGWMLFGPSGTHTDMHFDLANALYVQVMGKKHFKLVSPLDMPYVYPFRNFLSLLDFNQGIDYERFPEARNARIYELTVEPGDIMFLPIGWWHYAESEGVSISCSFSNFYTTESYKQFMDVHGTHPLIND